jgi:hypothetical protein
MAVGSLARTPDSHELGKSWVARGIEEFKDGEWVTELIQYCIFN